MGRGKGAGSIVASSSLALVGDEALKAALIELGNVSGLRALRAAIGKALIPVKQQVKTNSLKNKRSGAIYRSVALKSWRRGFNAKGKIYIKSGWTVWDGKMINPAKYAHLVEFGTRHSKPFPFMRTAVEQQQSNIKKIMISEGWNQIDKEAKRVKNKYGTMRIRR